MRLLRLAVAGTILVMAAPAVADEAEDLQVCRTGTEPADRIGACTRLIDAGDQDPADLLLIYTARGDAYFAEDDYEAAVADYSEVIALDPDNPAAYSGRGQAYLYLDRLGEARADLQHATELDPRSYWEFNRLGLVLEQLGEDELALENYSRALQLNPNSNNTYSLRGNLYLTNERFDEARADFTSAIYIVPLSASLYSARGQANLGLGDTTAAIHDYRIAQLLNPLLTTPREELETLAPPSEPPASLPVLAYAPPMPGLQITYVEVTNDEAPKVDHVVAAIYDLLGFDITPKLVLPTASVETRRDIGETSQNTTTVTETRLGGRGDEGPVVTAEYAYSILPRTLSIPIGPSIFLAYDEHAAEIWRLIPGETIGGESGLFLACAPEPDPIATMLGCTGEVEAVQVGHATWTAAFDGWEYVLVPAGQRLTARISYSETMNIEILGQVILGTSEVTWWIDPDINWWIRQQRTEQGVVRTFEAMTIVQAD